MFSCQVVTLTRQLLQLWSRFICNLSFLGLFFFQCLSDPRFLLDFQFQLCHPGLHRLSLFAHKRLSSDVPNRAFEVVTFVCYLLDLSLQVGSFNCLPVQSWVLQLYLLVLLRNLSYLLLQLGCVVFALLEDSFILNKIFLQVFYLNVAVSYFSKHALNLSSNPFYAMSSTLDSARSRVQFVQLILQI